MSVNEIDFKAPEATKGRKKKLYLVLDTETCTLPFVKEMELTAKQKQNIALAKPLVYDIGWKIVDAIGIVYSQHSFLIQETFFVPQVFNTAYYANKRPLYMERYNNGEIIVKTWDEATAIMVSDLEKAGISTAFNAAFDFKKAIPFTERYIKALYSNNYEEWEQRQRKSALKIAYKVKPEPHPTDPENFNFRGVNYPIVDLWGMTCIHLINNEAYKMNCLVNGMISESGIYFKTSAETAFRYLDKDNEFIEEHTALSDVHIETEIMLKVLKKVGLKPGIEYVPFQKLGSPKDFIVNCKKQSGIELEHVNMVLDMLHTKLFTSRPDTGFATTVRNNIIDLEEYSLTRFEEPLSGVYYQCKIFFIERDIRRLASYGATLKPEGEARERVRCKIEKLRGYLMELQEMLQDVTAE